MAGTIKKGEKKPESRLLKIVLEKLDYPDLLTMLLDLYPDPIGRNDVTDDLCRRLSERGMTKKFSPSTVWNWVTTAHTWGIFDSKDWDFHGKRKNNPYLLKSKRDKKGSNLASIEYHCQQCQHIYQIEKQIWNDNRQGINPNNMYLKIHRCPSCDRHGSCIAKITHGEIVAQKMLLPMDGITFECFVNEEGTEIPSPFGEQKFTVEEREKTIKALRKKRKTQSTQEVGV